MRVKVKSFYQKIKDYGVLVYSVFQKDGVAGIYDHSCHILKKVQQGVTRKQKFTKGSIVFLSECPGPAMRYRCEHAVEQLSKINIKSNAYEISKVNFENCIKAHEIIVLHRVLHTPKREKIIKRAQKSGKIFIFDTDDLVFNLDKVDSIKKLPQVQYRFLLGEFQRLQNTLKLCDYAIGSTAKMKLELERFLPKKCFTHPNMVSDWEFENAGKVVQKIKREKNGKIVLGYASGTRTHDDDFLEIESVLLQILKKYPTAILRIVGHLKLSKRFDRFKNQVEKKELVHWKKLPLELSQFDINLAPLENLELNEAKSDLKFFEAACVGVPTVATDVGAFHENIKHGETGFLAKDKKDWFEKIEKLISDKKLRQKVGAKAQQHVQKFRNSEKGAGNFQKILQEI